MVGLIPQKRIIKNFFLSSAREVMFPPRSVLMVG